MRRFSLLVSLLAVLGSAIVLATGAPVGAAPSAPAARPVPATGPPSSPDASPLLGPFPASSGQSPEVLPTGPARPGPRPGTVTVNNDGHPLSCALPPNPYAGAQVITKMVRPGLVVREYFQHYRTRMFIAFLHLVGSGSRIRPGPLQRGPVAYESTMRDKLVGTTAYGASSGDFFDLGRTGAPYGAEIARGAQIVKGLSYHQPEFMIRTDGAAALGASWLTINVHTPTGAVVSGTAYNSVFLPTDTVAIFDRRWGSFPLNRTLHPTQPVREYVVQNRRVIAVYDHVTATPVPAGGFIVVGQGQGAGRLVQGGMWLGRQSWIGLGQHSSAPLPVDSAIGVGMTIVRDGVRQGSICSVDRPVARTIIGYTGSGADMFVATVSGSTDAATGQTYGLTARDSTELAHDLGASNAAMLDGGGSVGMFGRTLYNQIVQWTVPQYGYDRAIGNGYGFWRR